METSEAWLAWAVELALGKCPSTFWSPSSFVDYPGQLLRRSSIRGQFAEILRDGTAGLETALEQWATTGRWPRLRRAEQFFLRLILQDALEILRSEELDNKTDGFQKPPWTAEQATILSTEVVYAWVEVLADQWIEDQTDEVYGFQTDLHRMHNQEE